MPRPSPHYIKPYRNAQAAWLLCLLLATGAAVDLAAQPIGGDPVATPELRCTTIEVFSRTGCPHCADAYDFLGELQQSQPAIEVIRRDVFLSDDNRNRFIDLIRRYDLDRAAVPTFVICGEVLIGFDHPAGQGLKIRQMLGLVPGDPDPESATTDIVDLPLFGRISLERIGLPLFTLVIGLIDGFNPCAMWVLVFLLSILVNLRNPRRIALIAGTFVFISGAVYFAFMAAWLNVFLVVGFVRWFQILVGLFALLIGSIHIKDFFAYRRGISLSIPESAKPGIYARVRGVVQAENLTAALIGVAALAILVNLVELLCTAGLPAVYTQILVLQDLPPASYYLYLLLYNLAYIFDDALLVTVVVLSLRHYKLQQRQGRLLKLISGAVIAALGLVLILAPEWLLLSG